MKSSALEGDNICPICFDDLNDTDILQGKLKPCNHKYHYDCIRRWHGYSDNSDCPLCRCQPKTMIVLSRNHNGVETIDHTINFEIGVLANLSARMADLILQQEIAQEVARSERETREMYGSEDVRNSSTLYAVRDEEEEGSLSGSDASYYHSQIESRSRLFYANENREIEWWICGLCNVDIHGIPSESVHCADCNRSYHRSCLTSLIIEVGNTSGHEEECPACGSYLGELVIDDLDISSSTKDRLDHSGIQGIDGVFTRTSLSSSEGDQFENSLLTNINSFTPQYENTEESTDSLVGENSNQNVDTSPCCLGSRDRVACTRLTEATHLEKKYQTTSRGTTTPPENDFESLIETKTKIQEHVRKELKKYYRNETTGISISKETFTDINRVVSRRLYALSDFRYISDMDYDKLARENIVLEIKSLEGPALG
ncbi:hypothetical protein NCAS_0A11350 [Naumovozyma castellii]|uniref:RING-type domain-containing protein n=1 Tax=Naumovozyma castellii TaxID=27288 RepID=G0V895_NAUCA|nr:hypothetical protein NCAS_0A11350 [Naumovozyma castellii CBS 4309]CCC67693.1 hypothetical protein NCAS_0A11350 [Naumovozyma castellii CBS 4309]